MAGSFLDTNVLIYLASHDLRKAAIAEQKLREGGTISVQVLNEIANVARRKMQLTWPELADFLGLIRGLLTVTPLSVETHELGLDLASRYHVSLYDSMIVAAALLAGCDTLWSEDMQHGQEIDQRLRILNPFAPPG
jgi:predicted nucleic acid-binding protein